MMSEKTKKVIQIFLVFLKIGAFTFGGGYAMIALLENEFVSKKKWIEKDEFLNIAAIAESTPGPIAINAATYIGYKKLGIMGSVVSTLGVCIPSFVIIYVISLFFNAFLQLEFIQHIFKGVQVGVVYLIFSAGLKMLKSIERNCFNIVILFSSFACLLSLSLLAVNFSTIFYILISGTAGVVIYLLRRLKKEKRK